MTNLSQQLIELRNLWCKEKTKVLETSSTVLLALANRLRSDTVQSEILSANCRDLENLAEDDPMYDRLLLDKKSLNGMATDLERVATLPCPIGEELYRYHMPNGAEVRQCRVSIGLILVIYESRPNVTIDLFALALRTGNLLLLKGGKEAFESNECLVRIIRDELKACELAAEWVNLLGTSRQDLGLLLEQHRYIDLCIPRGSANLIRFVRENSRVPVIETGAGVVHVFCDASASPEMAAQIIYNSKMRRLSVCNALDCLLLHENLSSILPSLVVALAKSQVQLHCDRFSLKILAPHYPANLLLPAQDYGLEFLSAKMCIKVVADIDEAVEHIQQYGSRHTEVIVTEDENNAELFCKQVDAAAVFVNMASGFSDGGQLGLGAEVGISTQKLHARGPMGLEALTCVQWVGRGQGQIRL